MISFKQLSYKLPSRKLFSLATATLLSLAVLSGCDRSDQVVGESGEWTYEKYEEARLAEEAAMTNAGK
jgi:hypothetical protein